MARSADLPGSNANHRLVADPRIRVFDRIAWIYGFLFHVQRLAYRRTLTALLQRLDVPRKARILDIGFGNGACISVLAEMGHEAWAVDASPRMLAAARRLLWNAGLEAHEVRLSVGDPLKGLEFPDRYFDLVLASHVVHGLPPAQRAAGAEGVFPPSRGAEHCLRLGLVRRTRAVKANAFFQT